MHMRLRRQAAVAHSAAADNERWNLLEQIYANYEEMNIQQQEIEKRRKEFNIELFHANKRKIDQLLQPVEDREEYVRLGDWETYEKVEQVIKKFVYARSDTLHKPNEVEELMNERISSLNAVDEANKKRIMKLEKSLAAVQEELSGVMYLLCVSEQEVSKLKSQSLVNAMEAKQWQRALNALQGTSNVDESELYKDMRLLIQINKKMEKENMRLNNLINNAAVAPIQIERLRAEEKSSAIEQSYHAMESSTAMDTSSSLLIGDDGNDTGVVASGVRSRASRSSRRVSWGRNMSPHGGLETRRTSSSMHSQARRPTASEADTMEVDGVGELGDDCPLKSDTTYEGFVDHVHGDGTLTDGDAEEEERFRLTQHLTRRQHIVEEAPLTAALMSIELEREKWQKRLQLEVELNLLVRDYDANVVLNEGLPEQEVDCAAELASSTGAPSTTLSEVRDLGPTPREKRGPTHERVSARTTASRHDGKVESHRSRAGRGAALSATQKPTDRVFVPTLAEIADEDKPLCDFSASSNALPVASNGNSLGSFSPRSVVGPSPFRSRNATSRKTRQSAFQTEDDSYTSDSQASVRRMSWSKVPCDSRSLPSGVGSSVSSDCKGMPSSSKVASLSLAHGTLGTEKVCQFDDGSCTRAERYPTTETSSGEAPVVDYSNFESTFHAYSGEGAQLSSEQQDEVDVQVSAELVDEREALASKKRKKERRRGDRLPTVDENNGAVTVASTTHRFSSAKVAGGVAMASEGRRVRNSKKGRRNFAGNKQLSGAIGGFASDVWTLQKEYDAFRVEMNDMFRILANCVGVLVNCAERTNDNAGEDIGALASVLARDVVQSVVGERVRERLSEQGVLPERYAGPSCELTDQQWAHNQLVGEIEEKTREQVEVIMKAAGMVFTEGECGGTSIASPLPLEGKVLPRERFPLRAVLQGAVNHGENDNVTRVHTLEANCVENTVPDLSVDRNAMEDGLHEGAACQFGGQDNIDGGGGVESRKESRCSSTFRRRSEKSIPRSDRSELQIAGQCITYSKRASLANNRDVHARMGEGCNPLYRLADDDGTGDANLPWSPRYEELQVAGQCMGYPKPPSRVCHEVFVPKQKEWKSPQRSQPSTRHELIDPSETSPPERVEAILAYKPVAALHNSDNTLHKELAENCGAYRPPLPLERLSVNNMLGLHRDREMERAETHVVDVQRLGWRWSDWYSTHQARKSEPRDSQRHPQPVSPAERPRKVPDARPPYGSILEYVRSLQPARGCKSGKKPDLAVCGGGFGLETVISKAKTIVHEHMHEARQHLRGRRFESVFQNEILPLAKAVKRMREGAAPSMPTAESIRQCRVDDELRRKKMARFLMRVVVTNIRANRFVSSRYTGSAFTAFVVVLWRRWRETWRKKYQGMRRERREGLQRVLNILLADILVGPRRSRADSHSPRDAPCSLWHPSSSHFRDAQLPR
ncbi:hypothetical protein ERJ75_000255800 [Trypanosoma vivax]|nr:hypothetical protein ERJ75_000255800 [Trypanosoma vivax]